MDDRPLPAELERFLGGLTRVVEGLVDGAARMAGRARTGMHQQITAHVARLRAGEPVAATVLSLFKAVLEDAGGDPGPSAGHGPADGGGETATDPVPRVDRSDDSGPPGPDELPPEFTTLSHELRVAVQRAEGAQGLVPAESADVVAWALTSLLMTLMMRARDGEDPDKLVAVAQAAMVDLLGGAG